MDLVSTLAQFINLPTLIGIVILSRHLGRGWQIAIGVTLVLFGLLSIGSR